MEKTRDIGKLEERGRQREVLRQKRNISKRTEILVPRLFGGDVQTLAGEGDTLGSPRATRLAVRRSSRCL